MAPTPSTRVRAQLQEYNTNAEAWGDLLNITALQLLDDARGQFTTKALVGDYTLDVQDYLPDEARAASIRFTGTGTFTVTAPAVSYWYIIQNDCTGDLTLKPSGGTGAVIRAGTRAVWYTDGTTGYVVDPTLDKIKAAAADVAFGGFKATNVGAPTLSTDAATKGYVDAANSDRSMGGFKITNLANGTASTDAINKSQLDAGIFTIAGGLAAGTAAGQAVIWNGTNYIATQLDLADADGVTGTLPVGNGGTGAATLTANRVLLGNGTGAIAVAGAGTSGQVLTSNGASAPTFQTVQASGYIRLSETVVGSAVATVDITANINSTYDIYVLELLNVRPSTDAVQLLCRVSTDGGSSFLSSTYVGNVQTRSGGSGTYVAGASGSSAFGLTGSSVTVGNASNENGVSGFIYFYRPAVSQWLQTSWTINFTESGASLFAGTAGEAAVQTVSAYNAVRLLFSSGNVASGTLRLGAIRNAP